MRSGILRVYPDAEVKVLPLADGGEGTVEALTLGMGGQLQNTKVTGPLGQKVLASVKPRSHLYESPDMQSSALSSSVGVATATPPSSS